MGLISRCQKSELTYWPLTGTQSNGQPIYGAPKQITCRWDDRISEVQGQRQTVVLSKHQIITEIKLTPGDMVLHLPLVQVPYRDVPKDNPGAVEVIAVAETPNLRHTETLYEAWA